MTRLREVGAEARASWSRRHPRDVDVGDPAFAQPTKPIGPFVTAPRPSGYRRAGWMMLEDAGRGYRRVVPSPGRSEILEIQAVRTLVDDGCWSSPTEAAASPSC